MNRQGHEDTKFFLGPEVELTPAHAKRTLFVVGEQPLAEILHMAVENQTPHIFMGANHSFAPSDYWNEVILALLDKGYTVTLDYPVQHHAELHDSLHATVWSSRNFIPLVSVRLPWIEESGHNLTVKIDDIDFAATNPGVWCLHYSEVTDSNRFTAWQEYETDQILGQDLETPADTETAPEATVTLEPEQPAEPVALNDETAGLDLSAATTVVEETAAPAGIDELVAVDPADAEEAVAEPAVEDTAKKTKAKKNDQVA